MTDFTLKVKAVEFTGQPVSFDDDGTEIRVIHTYRGFTMRRGPQCIPIALGDWIIYEPFFKVVSASRWQSIKDKSDGNN